MKHKLRLAIDAVEKRDLISDENRRCFGEGFIQGFEKAKEMIMNEVKDGWIDIPLVRLAELGETEDQFVYEVCNSERTISFIFQTEESAKDYVSYLACNGLEVRERLLHQGGMPKNQS